MVTSGVQYMGTYGKVGNGNWKLETEMGTKNTPITGCSQ